VTDRAVPVTVILVCPCCASTVDAKDDGTESFTCTVCAQQWVMTLDVDRLHQFSLY
jgi:hypothetical protein